MTIQPQRSAPGRYAVAVVAWLAAMGLRWAFGPVMGAATYLPAYPAIMVSAWYGGLGPGVLCTVLAGAATAYFFIPPYHTLLVLRPADAVPLAGFILVGIAFSALVDGLVRARSEADQRRRWFRQTLASIGDGVIATDASGHVNFMNRVAERLTGWTSADATGRPIHEIFYISNEQTGSPVENPVGRVLAEGTVVGLANHTVLRSREGNVCPIADSAAPIRDESSHTLGAVLVFRDVSEERRAHKQIEASRAQLTRILESISDGFLAVDNEWRVTYANSAVERMLRSGHGELTGRKLWELYPDAQGTLVQEECERAKREQASVQFEHYSRALGRWFEMSAYPADPGLSVFFRDVTERKQTEALVREAHALLDAFFENAPVGLGLWDRDLRFVRVNQALAEINGVPVEAHAGRTLHELLPRMGPEVLSAFKRVFDTGEPLTGAEASGETPAAPGKIRCWSVSYYPIRVGDEVRFVSAICEEITERKAAETALRAVTEELHRANSDLRLFAYAASHDLQEPLRMVTSYLGLLSRRYGNSLGDDARDFIGYAVDGARRMERLLEDLREYWRAASPADTPPSLTSMDSALDTALGNLAAAIHEADAVVTREPLPNVLANETPLVQVFQNLISNAIKYRRKERPTVHISAERDGEAMWRFSVRDNGIGIPREHAIDVFTAFKRLHGREVPGTGLGLVICAKIIERYGGSIWVESEAGAGSTFRFTLPAADGRA